MSDRQIPTKAQRIAEFFSRLSAAPAVASADDAFALLCNTLNAVEDELTGIPFSPSTWATDGRLYPPQADREFAEESRPGVRQFHSVAHITAISPDGSIEIRDRATGKVFFHKPGRSE